MPATFSRSVSSESRFRSSLFPLGSPIIPVAPPTSAMGLCPALKTPQNHERHQVADVHAVGRGIEAHVDRARFFPQEPLQINIVGGLID